jgi:RNA ligase (TIGR02306 family)
MRMSDLSILAVKVDAIYPHINADKLEIVKIGAYQTCETKGKYQVGDVVAHFPPDILIPPKVAVQLGVENYLKDAVYPGDSEKSRCRVGAIRLRGAASFGFLVPAQRRDICDTIKVDVEAGTDLTDRFHGVKYEPPEPEWFRVGDNAKNDPRFTSIQIFKIIEILSIGMQFHLERQCV